MAVGQSSALALPGPIICQLLPTDDDTHWIATVAVGIHRHRPAATSQGDLSCMRRTAFFTFTGLLDNPAENFQGKLYSPAAKPHIWAERGFGV